MLICPEILPGPKITSFKSFQNSALVIKCDKWLTNFQLQGTHHRLVDQVGSSGT